MYSHRAYLRLAITFSILLLTALPICNSADVRPNIVVMLVDDMGMMDTSVPFLTDEAGEPKRYPLNDFYRTPNMERLAASGVRFNNFYAMSVCSPTRISIMTGQNAARHRTTNWINPDRDNAGPNGPKEWNWKGIQKSNTTLAKLLQQSGYRTIHVGKGHFGPRDSEGAEPLNLGFDVNVGGCSIGQPGSYYAKQNFRQNQKSVEKTTGKSSGKSAENPNGKWDGNAVPHLEKYHGSELFLTEALTLEAQAHVSAAVDEGKPFFLYFPQYAVHAPFNADPRFESNYKDSGKSPQAQAFATLVEGMDKSLGDILDHIEKIGAAENTLVIFLGDNGSDAPLGHQHAVACAAPLRGKKGAHYEGGMRVPFIASWAKPVVNSAIQQSLPIKAGAIQSQVASICDLFPTLLSLAKVQLPTNHKLDGKRLDRLMTAQPDGDRDEIFLMHYPHSPHRSDYFTVYREGDWKVIYHYLPTDVSAGSHYQLFNLKVDPFEQSDLATQDPKELRRMMQRLAAALKDCDAVYPVGAKGESLLPIIP